MNKFEKFLKGKADKLPQADFPLNPEIIQKNQDKASHYKPNILKNVLQIAACLVFVVGIIVFVQNKDRFSDISTPENTETTANTLITTAETEITQTTEIISEGTGLFSKSGKVSGMNEVWVEEFGNDYSYELFTLKNYDINENYGFLRQYLLRFDVNAEPNESHIVVPIKSYEEMQKIFSFYDVDINESLDNTEKFTEMLQMYQDFLAEYDYETAFNDSEFCLVYLDGLGGYLEYNLAEVLYSGHRDLDENNNGVINDGKMEFFLRTQQSETYSSRNENCQLALVKFPKGYTESLGIETFLSYAQTPVIATTTLDLTYSETPPLFHKYYSKFTLDFHGLADNGKNYAIMHNPDWLFVYDLDESLLIRSYNLGKVGLQDAEVKVSKSGLKIMLHKPDSEKMWILNLVYDNGWAEELDYQENYMEYSDSIERQTGYATRYVGGVQNYVDICFALVDGCGTMLFGANDVLDDLGQVEYSVFIKQNEYESAEKTLHDYLGVTDGYFFAGMKRFGDENCYIFDVYNLAEQVAVTTGSVKYTRVITTDGYGVWNPIDPENIKDCILANKKGTISIKEPGSVINTDAYKFTVKDPRIVDQNDTDYVIPEGFKLVYVKIKITDVIENINFKLSDFSLHHVPRYDPLKPVNSENVSIENIKEWMPLPAEFELKIGNEYAGEILFLMPISSPGETEPPEFYYDQWILEYNFTHFRSPTDSFTILCLF